MISEVAAAKEEGFIEAYRVVKELCQDEMIQGIYRELPDGFLNRNSKIYKGWVLKKRVLLLTVYYGILKR
jgi:hypothetical protein